MTMSISYSILNKSIKFGPVDVGEQGPVLGHKDD